MTHSVGLLIVLAGIALGALSSQPQGQPPVTLRAALARYGFDNAVGAADAPRLDAPLTSSEFGASPTAFAAAYYFRDELKGEGFGRLHVSVFDRPSGRWKHAPAVRKPVGSVLGVRVSARYVLIEGHASPSAGVGVLLNRASLRVVTRLPGYGLRLLRGDTILYHANMVHFAPLHQERLIVFDPQTRREVEIFPGKQESAIAATYRRSIRATYDSLPAAQKATFEQSAYGPVADFDRSISFLADRPTGDRLAFVASYDSDRLDKKIPRAQALVECDRKASLVWSCSERDLDEAARAYAFELRRQPNGWFESADIDPLIKRVLDR